MARRNATMALAREAFVFRFIHVSLTLGFTVLCPRVLGDDPWPEWQRTPARLGSTSTIGPQTPTIAWSVRVDPSGNEGQQRSTPLMDANGRIYAGHHVGLTAVDSQTHEILWRFRSDSVDQGASLWNGRLLFGTPEDLFYCIDAVTGDEIWRRPAEPHPNRGSVVDDDGIVYYPSQLNVLYARRVSDGSEVWTHNHPDFFNSAPALDGVGQLYIGNLDRGQWLAFETPTARIVWDFRIASVPALTSPVQDGRVYVPSIGGRKLFCLDAATGEEIWSFPTEVTGGGAALRPDGSIVVNASGGRGWLFAVTPDGQELWRYRFTDQGVGNPPIVDGAGNTYFGTFWANSDGWVHAVGADGVALWVKEMPNQVSASPMLAPDGTLYVMCRDKFLYAFRDPAGDLDFDGDIDLEDFKTFDECMTRPRKWGEDSLIIPGCELYDFNSDWDVDLQDFSQFQLQFAPK